MSARETQTQETDNKQKYSTNSKFHRQSNKESEGGRRGPQWDSGRVLARTALRDWGFCSATPRTSPGAGLGVRHLGEKLKRKNERFSVSLSLSLSLSLSYLGPGRVGSPIMSHRIPGLAVVSNWTHSFNEVHLVESRCSCNSEMSAPECLIPKRMRFSCFDDTFRAVGRLRPRV